MNFSEDSLKVVLDTSVIISANYRSRGYSFPSQIWQAFIDNKFTLIISPQILREIVSTSRKIPDFPETRIGEIIQIINQKTKKISGSYNTTYLDDIDAKDNMFLAAAYEAKANYLVSLDKQHILPIKYFYGTQILNPELFIRFLNNIKNN